MSYNKRKRSYKMKTISLYTPEELKEENPEGFERAHEWYKSINDEIPWSGEIIDSLKAIFKASGIHLRDYSIDAYGYSSVSFDMESETEDLKGQRALAWIENNLLADLRIKWQPYGRVDKEHQFKSVRAELSKYGQYYRPGMVHPCPFTGVCFDEDMIESLLKSVKSGDTLGEAYHNLANVAAKLFESEIEQGNSEEEFLMQEHLTFTFEGRHV
jgi:hypothetical protein